MKKVSILFILFIAGLIPTQAQYFISGSLGANAKTIKIDNKGIKNTILTFQIHPKLGYWLNDNMAIGAGTGFFASRNNDVKIFGINTFLFTRHKIYNPGKFTVMLETPLGFSAYSVLQKFRPKDSYTKTKATTMVDLNIYPLLSYKPTDNFTLLLKTNFLNFGLSISKENDLLKNEIQTTSEFGLNAQSSLLNTSDGINIGFSYNLNSKA